MILIVQISQKTFVTQSPICMSSPPQPKFPHFHAVFGKIYKIIGWHPPGSWLPLFGEILDPPQTSKVLILNCLNIINVYNLYIKIICFKNVFATKLSFLITKMCVTQKLEGFSPAMPYQSISRLNPTFFVGKFLLSLYTGRICCQ